MEKENVKSKFALKWFIAVLSSQKRVEIEPILQKLLKNMMGAMYESSFCCLTSSLKFFFLLFFIAIL